MPYNTNDLTYQTKNSRILNFNDFDSNIRKEKEDLKKIDRSSINFDNEINQTPGDPKKKYNRVTHKLDDLSREEVKDKVKAIEDMSIEDPKHKWKAEIPTQQSSENENFRYKNRKNIKRY